MDANEMSTDAVAEELAITPQRVRAMIRAGKLKAKVIGEGNRATYLIKRTDLDAVRNRKPGRPRKKTSVATKKPVGRPKKNTHRKESP